MITINSHHLGDLLDAISWEGLNTKYDLRADYFDNLENFNLPFHWDTWEEGETLKDRFNDSFREEQRIELRGPPYKEHRFRANSLCILTNYKLIVKLMGSSHLFCLTKEAHTSQLGFYTLVGKGEDWFHIKPYNF